MSEEPNVKAQARSTRKERGFTLLELMVVIVLVALVSTTFLNLGGWNCTTKVRNDFDDLNGFLQTLRAQAMSFNRTTRARFESTTQVHPEVWTNTDSQRDCEAAGYLHLPLTDEGVALGDDEAYMNKYDLIPDRSEYAGSTGFKVCFNPDGTATPKTISVTATCGDKAIHYKTQIFGATGFFETTKLNATTNSWKEL